MIDYNKVLPNPQSIEPNTVLCITIMNENKIFETRIFQNIIIDGTAIWQQQKGCQIIVQQNESIDEQKLIDFLANQNLNK